MMHRVGLRVANVRVTASSLRTDIITLLVALDWTIRAPHGTISEESFFHQGWVDSGLMDCRLLTVVKYGFSAQLGPR